MPLGLVLWKWDTRSGGEILGKFPKETDLSLKSLMQLYSQHMYSKKADIVSMYVGALNILSMWTGSLHNYFLTLLLRPEEDAEDYSDLMSDIMFYLIPYIEQETFHPLLPSILQRFEEYPQANEEQRSAIIYANEVNRAILQLLEDEGTFFKDELKIWLEDNLHTPVFNFEMALDRLSHDNLIKIASVKGLEGTYVFLVRDLVVMRAPPLRIEEKGLDAASFEIREKISKEIRDYFKYYYPTTRDNIELAKIMQETNYFRIIDLLRKTHAPQSLLTKLRLFGVGNVMDLIQNLQNFDIINSIENQNKEIIYYLQSDIVIETIRPDYIMRQIFEMNRKRAKNPIILQDYIKILRDAFFEQQKIDNTQKIQLKNKKSSSTSTPSYVFESVSREDLDISGDNPFLGNVSSGEEQT
ncbi:MAG: hypothetical protein ACTSYU_05555 [Promethearchaeota archaeon]